MSDDDSSSGSDSSSSVDSSALYEEAVAAAYCNARDVGGSVSAEARLASLHRSGLAAIAPSLCSEVLAAARELASRAPAAHAPVAGAAAAAASAPPHRAAAAAAAAVPRAPPRAAAVAAQHAIHASSESAGPPLSDNYPPINPSKCQTEHGHKRQLYRIDNWEYGLQSNAKFLGTEVAVSDMLPDAQAGLGLFATRRFEEGELVGYLWGKFVTREQWTAIKHRQFDATWRQGEECYVSPVKQGIQRLVEVPPQQNGACMLLASQQCPIAYINQGFAQETYNVEMVAPQDRFDGARASTASAYQYMEFRVRTQQQQGIHAGEEFQVNYHWEKKEIEQAQKVYLAHLAQLRKARPGTLRGTFDLMRMGHATSVPTLGASSVVTESVVSTDSTASHRKRAALERVDRCYDGVEYACCQKACHKQVPRVWITATRSAHAAVLLLIDSIR